MTRDHEPSEGWKLWQKLSDDKEIKDLPPLNRLITGIRKKSKNKDELVNNAYLLCEENIDIIKYEYSQWKGQAIFDATSVFSFEGIGGDLINQYGLNFEDYLRIIGELAKRTKNPAQYHQCINTNLQRSSYDDEIIIERMKSLKNYTSPDNLTISPTPLSIEKIVGKSLDNFEQSKNVEREEKITIYTHSKSFCCFTRRIGLNFDGEVIIGGPLFMNTYLIKPFAWLASIDLDVPKTVLQERSFTLAYSILSHNEYISNCSLKLLLDSTPESKGSSHKDEHNFLIYDHSLPIGDRKEESIDFSPIKWKAIDGNQNTAYGLKCKTSKPEEILHRSNKRLILALETGTSPCIYEFSMNVPSITF